MIWEEKVQVSDLISTQEIENSYFLHYCIKSQAPLMSSQIKFNVNWKERIYLSIPSAWRQEPIIFGNYNLHWCLWGLCSSFRPMFSGCFTMIQVVKDILCHHVQTWGYLLIKYFLKFIMIVYFNTPSLFWGYTEGPVLIRTWWPLYWCVRFGKLITFKK